MARLIIPQEISEVLRYCSKTGEIRWRTQVANNIKAGSIAGTLNKGYRKINRRGTIYFAHRLAWFLHYGEQPPEIIDHINGDRTDNRIDNLRAVTSVGSNINKLGHHGVSWTKSYNGRKGFWSATLSRRNVYRGPNLFEAWCRRKSAENVYWSSHYCI